MKSKRKATFGDVIRVQRQSKDIGLRKLAESVGISATYLSKIERNELDPPAENRIVDIARLLDLDTDALMALAKRVPADVQEFLESHPAEAVLLLRKAREVGLRRLAAILEKLEK